MESPRLEAIRSSSDISHLHFLALSMWLLFSWCKFGYSSSGQEKEGKGKVKSVCQLPYTLFIKESRAFPEAPCRDSDFYHKGVWGGEAF